MQVLFLHDWVSVQVMLQPPQLKRSFVVLTQPPLQITSPGLHLAVHWPASHSGIPAGHCTPQPPQLEASLCMSTQLPLQWVSCVGHSHVPLWQGLPPQSVAQSPQCMLFDWRSTQDPLQLNMPLLHMSTQVPVSHGWPIGQAIPHAPQFCGELLRSTQVPPQLT
jgi:hypothetical protein